MKRTVAALAAGLLPGLVVSSVADARQRTSVVEPSTADADVPTSEGAASSEGASSDAAAEPAQPGAPKPPAPKPPAPKPPVDTEADASGSAELGSGRRSLRKKKDAEAKAEAEPNYEDDPRAYEKAKAKERPWIRRWEPARNLAELGLFGGLLRPSDEHDLYDPVTRPQDPLWKLGPDVGVRAAFFPLKPLGVEAEFSANPTRVRTITNDFAFVYGFRGHVIVQVPVTRIVPFFLGGYGLMGVRSHILILGNDIDPAFHYGGGVKFFINKWLVARLEARQIVSATAAQQDSGTSHFQALAGISVTLGRKRPVPPPYVAPVDPDRDKDGILNEADQCPDEPGVEPSGCPDTDGDGFIDKEDACIEVPGVEPDGCPLKDSDNDKIYDLEDDCPFEKETYNGIDDIDGCPDEIPPELVTFKGELPGIEFDFGKDTIRPESKPVLDDAIAKLKKFPGVRVTIVGHTDNVGTPESNLELSKRRAESVKRYLVEGGVDGSRIETDGKGDTEPVDTNENEEGRAKNRRIVFDIIANEPTEMRPLSGDKGVTDPDAKVVGGGAGGAEPKEGGQ
ncbi:OmpA family protein [Paraliomyxa miuraensis]|uniref:OmpA family protein n=1 Tax=Paraliomyxa miuraensis TaxID=376150 RepID=UPI0022555A95|nr:OmpA family protein [Paraliomyxa miuraensis]MCX4242234.1 OmpA family protein [Paraliomyxa miuraensis]